MKLLVYLLFIIAGLTIGSLIKARYQDRETFLKLYQSMEANFNMSNKHMYARSRESMQSKEGLSRDLNELVPYYERAIEARIISDEFVEFMDGLKNIEMNNDRVNILVTMIDSTRNRLLNLIQRTDSFAIDTHIISHMAASQFLKSDQYKPSNQTTAGTIPCLGWSTTIAKLQNECRILEAEILDILSSGYLYCGPTFSRIEPVVLPQSSSIAVGEEYRAEIMLTHVLDKLPYKILVNGKDIPIQHGKAIYTSKHKSPGVYHYEGDIKVRAIDGIRMYPFFVEYKVY